MKRKSRHISDRIPGIRLKKSLGQHLLMDRDILRDIVKACDLGDNTTVLEIGSGVANLTEGLAKNAREVAAIELDPQFSVYHSRIRMLYSNVDFIYGDVMDLDLNEIGMVKNAEDLVITGNIPYGITSPLIMKILESRLCFRVMVFMIQKEVAERINSPAGSKKVSAFTMKVRYYCETEIIRTVPRTSFKPPPRVDSAVLRFHPGKQHPLKEDERKDFFSLLKGAFSQKRKTVTNSLTNAFSGQFSKDEIREALLESGITPTQRAESIRFDQYMTLFKRFRQIKQKNNQN